MSLNKPELARLFYLEIVKIADNEAWSPAVKTDALAHLLELLFLEITKQEKIQFTTLFARIAYACHQQGVDKKTQYWIHLSRKKARHIASEPAPEKALELGYFATGAAIAGLLGEAPPEELAKIIPSKPPFRYSEIKVQAFKKKARVIAFSDDAANERLLAQDEDNPSQLIHIQYNITERNEPFNPTIRQIRSSFGFPVTLNLLDVEIVEGTATPHPSSLIPHPCYRPRAIVVEPDYLLDVSAVADCFQGSGAEPVLYLLKKFLPPEPTVAMMLGNIANFFLDELMHNVQASFKETFPKVFRINPLAFALLPDATIRELQQVSQKHFSNLFQLVSGGFKKFDVQPEECYLEPSFFSETYGLQGRLDVFFKQENRSAIIELKSGQPFMPNRYGIGTSHFIQTLLYDLLVRSVYGEEVEPACYILYSALETNQLRFAPPVKSEQNEALQLRNQLVAIDRLLAKNTGSIERMPLLERVNTARFPNLKGYARQNIEQFEKVYSPLDDLEKRYFNAFTGFIAREHQLAKTGIQGVDNANGLAALWLDSPEEKEANFQIIKRLKIRENRASEDEAMLVFEKTPETHPLANFRPGDIAVLYPLKDKKEENASHYNRWAGAASQIFKVTILRISNEEVRVRLRYKQFNLSIFGEFEYWNLEHDVMDMGFHAMYQGLFSFAKSDFKKRQLMLTTRAPNAPEAKPVSTLSANRFEAGAPLTEEQAEILEKMLAAEEYFLLWGPPGTGKTSLMLRHFAARIFEETDENLLLLAYTNRAVDEICESLESLGEQMKASYLRIGSQYSTDQRFVNQLLTKKMEKVAKRSELLEILGKHRIFVSTLASLANNQELLKLKKFRRIVIDEASQILEPSLVGLLPQFERFILIGDHKQLPAVVVQEPVASAIEDEMLQGIGIANLRNSLFERLYKRCISQGWHWAYSLLSHQGRMHRDIMRFPNEHFYEGKLKILPENIGAALRQMEPLASQKPDKQLVWKNLVGSRRIVFLPTLVDKESASRKTNRHEAELIATLIEYFQANEQAAAKKKGKIEAPKTIGVITPYRAQIAQIQEVLQEKKMDCIGLTIDTVERYQGGARDVILISLCTNSASQLESLVSLSEEGVDRKLNVALTRAREQVVILGNEILLVQNETYRKLIEFCRS